jgi:hypothetical protein
MFNIASEIPARSDLEWCWFLRGFGKAGDAIERALHRIGAMDHNGWVRWQRSTLTNTGAPVAVRFSTYDGVLSIITEVADPAQDPKARFASVCAAITALGAKAPDTAFREVISALQGSSSLTFGASLGLRYEGNALRFTLYIELPVGASDLTGLLSANDPQLPCNNATMLAYDLQTKQVTLHFSANAACRALLPATYANLQPVAIRHVLGDASRHSFKLAREDIASLGTPINTQLRNLQQRVSQSYPCLIDPQRTGAATTTNYGDIWVSDLETAVPLLSLDVAAPWIGADHPN